MTNANGATSRSDDSSRRSYRHSRTDIVAAVKAVAKARGTVAFTRADVQDELQLAAVAAGYPRRGACNILVTEVMRTVRAELMSAQGRSSSAEAPGSKESKADVRPVSDSENDGSRAALIDAKVRIERAIRMHFDLAVTRALREAYGVIEQYGQQESMSREVLYATSAECLERVRRGHITETRQHQQDVDELAKELNVEVALREAAEEREAAANRLVEALELALAPFSAHGGDATQSGAPSQSSAGGKCAGNASNTSVIDAAETI